MKYIILIHSNEQSPQLWDTLTEQQQMDFGRGHLKLTEEMAEAGELVVSEGLADPAPAKVEKALDRHHRVAAVRAHLLEMAGDSAAAREEYLQAARLTLSVPEQRYPQIRAGRLTG